MINTKGAGFVVFGSHGLIHGRHLGESVMIRVFNFRRVRSVVIVKAVEDNFDENDADLEELG